MAARIRELISKYGRVATVVHVSVSTVSFTTCYVAIKNNVDVNDILNRVGLLPTIDHGNPSELPERTVGEKVEKIAEQVSEKVDHAATKALSEGGALAMAFICNKALFPLRVPFTVILTPPISRIWAQRSFFRKT